MNGKVSKRLRKKSLHMATRSAGCKRYSDGSIRHPIGSPRWWYQKLKREWKGTNGINSKNNSV